MKALHYAILIGLVLVASGPAAAHPDIADTADDIRSVQADEPVENVTERLTVDVDESDTATVEIRVAYPARSASEAAAARNGTLEAEWFDGEERVQRLFDEIADDGDSLSSVSRSTRHEPSLWIDAAADPEPEHGWVLLRYDAAWEGYVERGENVTVGRAYVEALTANETRTWDQRELRVVAPESWEPAVLEGDPVVEPAGQTQQWYRWTIAGDEPDPLLVFESPVSTGDSTNGDSIDGVGVVGAAVALLLAVSIGGVRRRLE